MTDEDEPPIEYEPEPRITPLTGDEPGPDAATLAVIGWLLRRYSSLGYIERTSVLLRRVADAFLALPAPATRLPPDLLREWTHQLRAQDTALRQGLAALARGDAGKAYATVLDAVTGIEPADPRDERGFSLRQLGAALGAAEQLAAERAAAMALRIHHTLAARWASETILADRPSLQMRPRALPPGLPGLAPAAAGAPQARTGERIAVTGIWRPLTRRSACPNFLVAGRAAPPLTWACERIDYEATAASEWGPATPAWSDYEITESDTLWQLVWADGRYLHGARSDETGFLDEDNALPH